MDYFLFWRIRRKIVGCDHITARNLLFSHCIFHLFNFYTFISLLIILQLYCNPISLRTKTYTSFTAPIQNNNMCTIIGSLFYGTSNFDDLFRSRSVLTLSLRYAMAFSLNAWAVYWKTYEKRHFEISIIYKKNKVW